MAAEARFQRVLDWRDKRHAEYIERTHGWYEEQLRRAARKNDCLWAVVKAVQKLIALGMLKILPDGDLDRALKALAALDREEKT